MQWYVVVLIIALIVSVLLNIIFNSVAEQAIIERDRLADFIQRNRNKQYFPNEPIDKIKRGCKCK